MDTASAGPKPDLDRQRWDELIRQVGDLERRVVWLEQRLGATARGAPLASALDPTAVSQVLPTLAATSDAGPLLGRALLGIAGAYLLRALTELGVLPPGAGVAAGIVFANLWLLFAARTSENRRLAVVVNGLTAVCILGPLLWEATFRLNAIAPWTTAAVISAFFLAGLTLSWRKRLSILSGIAAVSSALMAVTMLVATHDLLPFTLALLMMAAAVEFAAGRDHAPGGRWFIAGMAGLSVSLLAYLVSREGGLPEGYAAISPLAALATPVLFLGIYLAGTGAPPLLRDRPFTNFETAQTALAFLIGLGGALRMVKGNGPGTFTVELFALFSGAACYAISCAFLGRDQTRTRNFHTYTTFGVLLLLAASILLFSGLGLAMVWAALAAGFCWAGFRLQQQILGWHGAVYLLFAFFASGVAAQSAAEFFGSGGAWPSLLPAGLVIAAAGLSYAALIRNGRIPALLSAGVLVWVVAGLAGSSLALAWQAVAGGPGGRLPRATLGTAVLTVLAAAIAWSVNRWRRAELVPLVYALMVLAAYKVVIRDSSQEHTLPLVVSLLLYGCTLILLPRILRARRR